MHTNDKTTPIWELRTILAGGGILLALLLSCQEAWPQASENPQAQQGTAARQAPQAQQEPQATPAPQTDLTQMSIEDLMNMKVTSASKKEQKLSRVAAAIYVITAEDIRRSGATNIPDLLRMVPGMDVAQINANTWAITSRGLNGVFANELLVMLDGRNVYTPTSGGVFWDALDLPLEDIDRIEVIRGPGGAIWGANAVNGVVNILTKKASETKGAMLEAGGGNLDQGFGTAQYGGSAGKSFDYRVYSKYFDQDHMPGLEGENGEDGWHILRGGFRTDSTLSAKDTLIFQGDLYTGEEGEPTSFLPAVTSPAPVEISAAGNLSGGFLQSVWNHTSSTGSATTLSVSYDDYTRRADQFPETRKTFDIDFQDHVSWGSRQDIVWGLGYRYSDSHADGNLYLSLNPAGVDSQYFSSFVQDEITLVPERLFLTLGTKLIHDYYTGFALLPTARAAYEFNARQTMWAAVSHAVRTPAEIDTSIRQNFGGFPGPGGVPVLVSLLGNPKIQNEGLIAYEWGYRATFRKRLSFDIAAYYNDDRNQESTEPSATFFEPTPAPPHFVMPSTFENLIHGETHGVEIAANWKIADRWTLSPGYDFERIHMHTSPLSQDTETVPETEGSDPHVNAQVRSQVELSQKWAWDASVYFVDRLKAEGVPSYTRLDTGLSWRWKEGVSLSLVGQNLLRDHHVEFIDSTGASRTTEVKRSAYAKIMWSF